MASTVFGVLFIISSGLFYGSAPITICPADKSLDNSYLLPASFS
jgi:hypothetical protein